MKKVLMLLFILLLSYQAAAEEKAFSITFLSDGDRLSLDSVELYAVEPPVYIDDDMYELRANMMSFSGQKLYSFDLSKEISVTDGGPRPEQVFMNYAIPYYRNAKEVVVRNKDTGNVEIVVDLAGLQLCNFDEYCDFDENEKTCPEDCVMGHAVREVEEEMLKDVRAEKDGKQKGKVGYVVALVAILVLGAAVAFIILRNNEKGYKQ